MTLRILIAFAVMLMLAAGYRARLRGHEAAFSHYWLQLLRYFKCWWCLKPHLVVGDPANPYLLRWWLIPQNPLFGVYLHKFLRDDDPRALHDHPRKSLSLLLHGRLREIVRRPSPCGCPLSETQTTDGYPHACHYVSEFTAPALVYRRAEHAHRLELPEDMPAWTLFLTGPWERDWGFLCPKGWVRWQQFIWGGNSLNGNSSVGSGCPE